MATTSISITPQDGNSSVIGINCGTSSPKLGGTINLLQFPNLQTFTCANNDITDITGYENNANITNIIFSRNKVSGSIPSLSALTNLVVFSCHNNVLTGSIPNLEFNTLLQNFQVDNQRGSTKLTGSIPTLSACPSLRVFVCHSNQLTGSFPDLNNNTLLRFFNIEANQLTGPIPSLSANPLLVEFSCRSNQFTGSFPSVDNLSQLTLLYWSTNLFTGSIPSLSSNRLLELFICSNQLGFPKLTGPIPSLSANAALRIFACDRNQLTGSIPSLSANTRLEDFRCYNNQLAGFDGGAVSNTLGYFQAQANLLTQTTVNTILSTFDATTRTASPRILNLGGTGNSAPSYTGGVTTTSTGSNFTTLGTTVTAAITNHNHPDGSLVTITGLQDVFTGTFTISSINANQFRYTVATNSPTLVTGSGTATMRRTTNANDGFRFYQNLARFGRLATTPGTAGFPWDVTVNLP